MCKDKKYNLVWFRNDLRVEDNNSLAKACRDNLPVLGMYFFDPRHFKKDKYGFKKTERFRAQFLIESVQNLQKNLKEKIHVSLLIFYDYPERVIPRLVKEYHVQKIFLQKEWTQEEVKVQQNLQAHIAEVRWVETYDQFLFHPEDIPYTSFQDIPEVFTWFRKKVENTTSVRSIIDLPHAQ